MAVAVREGVAGLAREWDDLAGRVGARPWHRPGWIEAWADAFGGELDLLAVRRDGRLVGVLPLLAGGRAPANWHSPSFALLAEDDAARDELLDLAAARGRLHLPLLEDGEEIAKALRGRGLAVAARTQLRSPYVPVAGSFEDYLAERGPGKKRRKNLERSRRKLDPVLDMQDGSERLEELLAEGFELERSGWKARTAVADDPTLTRFYTAVARWAAAEGMLRLLFLRVGGKAIAFELALEDGRSVYDIKGGYDPAFREHSPGQLVAYEVIAYTHARGLESYEFLGDAEPYKLEWAGEHVRERVLVDAFPRTPVGLARYALEAHARPLAKRLLRR